MRHILLSICYVGTNYHGWQIQKNALTVQEVFQGALFKVFDKIVDIKGCSRTDAGVHANMYCVSVKTESNIPCNRLKLAINKFLPGDIVVNAVVEVPLDFHARYSCIAKEYVYKIWNAPVMDPFLYGRALHYWHPIDTEELNLAAQYFIGTHNFTSFCTYDKRKSQNMIRTIKNFAIGKNGALVTIRVTANGFLYNMMRIMVGTLLLVARKKISPESIKDIIEAKDRAKAGPTAVACGLYLNKVFYENVNFNSF